MSQPLIVAPAASSSHGHETRIVVNGNIGQFGLSKMALELYASRKGLVAVDGDVAPGETADSGTEPLARAAFDRADPILVDVVEELGEASWGLGSELRIVRIPNGVGWVLREVAGYEFVEIRERLVAA